MQLFVCLRDGLYIISRVCLIYFEPCPQSFNQFVALFSYIRVPFLDSNFIVLQDVTYASSEVKIFRICSIPDVCIDERRLPLFIARATLRELIAGLEARATGDTAR